MSEKAKKEPKKIPLGYDDYQAGWIIKNDSYQAVISGITQSGISTVFGPFGFERLMMENFYYKCDPYDNRKETWMPCWKTEE